MTDRLKRLAYRAQRRGFKEADIIFSRFAEAHLAGFSPAEVDEFEQILDLQDHDVVAWVLGRSEPPQNLRGPVFDKFLVFARSGLPFNGK
ncbi:MAG: succinate dehydrogenase assembly factor 2 [Caulobacterales bacterium]